MKKVVVEEGGEYRRGGGCTGVDGKYKKATRELWSRTRSGELLLRQAAMGVN